MLSWAVVGENKNGDPETFSPLSFQMGNTPSTILYSLGMYLKYWANFFGPLPWKSSPITEKEEPDILLYTNLA
jgi:hypothetical protein